MTDLLAKSQLTGPIVTGSLLYLLTRSSVEVRSQILGRLQEHLSNDAISRILTALKVAFAYGVVKSANAFLSNLAVNNFYLFSQRSRWIWPREIAVVTGASSGFGLLFSRDLAAKGIQVAALDVSEAPKEFELNDKITFFKCDVTDPDAVNSVADDIRRTLGNPSILINNAGIGNGMSIMSTKPAYLRKIFAVNLQSHYYTIQAFAPAMVDAKKGHIINIASIASFVDAPGFADYAATKAGVLSMTETLRAEIRSFQKCPELLITSVHPGWAATALIADHVDDIKKQMHVMNPQKVSDKVVEQILSCRSAQLIIAPGAERAVYYRALPRWLTYLIMRRMESGIGRSAAGIQ